MGALGRRPRMFLTESAGKNTIHHIADYEAKTAKCREDSDFWEVQQSTNSILIIVAMF